MAELIDRGAVTKCLEELDALMKRRAETDDPEFVKVQVGITLASCEIDALPTIDVAFSDRKPRGPEIVCLCGSTRFYKTFDEQNFRLTLEDKIVLSIGCNTKSDEGLKLTAEDKIRLDELHKRKIDLADRVLVLNVGGYIGESTRSEIDYALSLRKPVDYLEPGNSPRTDADAPERAGGSQHEET